MEFRDGQLANRQEPPSGVLGFLAISQRIDTVVHTPVNAQVDTGTIVRLDSAHLPTGTSEPHALATFDRTTNLLIELQRRQQELEQQQAALARTQLEFEQARQRYVELYDSAPVGFCTLNEAGAILNANSAMIQLLGLTGSAFTGRLLRDFVCEKFRLMFDQRQRQLIATGQAQTFELKLYKSVSETFWGHVSAAVSSGRQSERTLRIVITDISSLKETEAALAESDRHLMMIADNMPGPVSRVNRDLRYLFVNPFYENITGRNPKSLVGLTMREVLGDELFNSIEPYIQRVLSGKLVTFPSQIKRPDGITHFGLTTYIPELNYENEVVGFFVVGLDITSSRLTEQALATTTDLLELTGRLACVGGWELDLTTNELVWTQETFRIHELDTLITPTLEEALRYFEPDTQTLLSHTIDEAIQRGTHWDLEVPLVTAKGNRIWVRTQGVVVYDHDRPIKLQGALHDITERKIAEAARTQLESQLRESQKMEAIGTLAGGVAHDFNNILAAIMGNADLAMHSLESPVVTLYCLQEISKASERARDLVRQILSFSRPHATERRMISLVDVVEESIRLLRATLPARVALTLECCNKVPRILADTTQLEQVILNLATNSYQAFQGRPGCISIHVDTVPLTPELLEATPHLKPLAGRVDQLVRMIVADDGPGIDSQVAEHLFEPFFTTKPVGEGTGLGLAVVHGIIRTHEGAITVESQPGEGAAFTIYLPVPVQITGEEAVVERVQESDEVNQLAPATASTLRILYVDDDQAVMQSIGKLLELRGFTVEGYSDQMEAVEAVRTRAAEFDLVVSDYNMPCLSGIDFAKFVRATRTDLPVVIISGLIDDELRIAAQNAGVSELISKPFSLNAFCNAVQRIAIPQEPSPTP